MSIYFSPIINGMYYSITQKFFIDKYKNATPFYFLSRVIVE